VDAEELFDPVHDETSAPAGMRWILPRSGLQPRHRHAVEWRAVALTGDAVPIGVQTVRISWIGSQHRLRLRLAREVGAVVAIALSDVPRRIESGERCRRDRDRRGRDRRGRDRRGRRRPLTARCAGGDRLARDGAARDDIGERAESERSPSAQEAALLAQELEEEDFVISTDRTAPLWIASIACVMGTVCIAGDWLRYT